MQAAFSKFSELTAEAQAARLLHWRREGLTSIRDLAVTTGLAVARVELLMCRGLSTLVARGYPAEELCETYHVTPEQLSRAAAVPVFSGTFKPPPISLAMTPGLRFRGRRAGKPKRKRRPKAALSHRAALTCAR